MLEIDNFQSNSSLKNSQLKFEDTFKVWCEYEKIAMHFNDLLIKLRVQALGAIAIIGTVSTALLKESAELPKYLFPLFFFLALGWIALYCLDMYYYNCLLQGAVKAIIEIEARNDKILNLSTNIEKEVKAHKLFGKLSGRKVFYSLIYLALVTVDIWCGWIGLSYGLNFIAFILSSIILICVMWFFFKEDICIVSQESKVGILKLIEGVMKLLKDKSSEDKA